MSETNGHTNGTADSREQLRAVRLSNRLERERISAARLGRARVREERRRRVLESLSVDWVTPYAELLDLTRRNGDPVLAGPSSFWMRRGGRNWPIYQTEAELNLLRAPARMLLATNGYAQGLVEGITSYLLGPGETFRIAKADEKDKGFPQEPISAAQDVVDQILEDNQWYGGKQPGISEELVGRSIEEGEWILCHYFREDGWTDFRIAEPEQLTQPPGSNWQEWGFGIKTPKDDAQHHERYYIQYGETPDLGEEYRPEEVTHFRRNVRRGMKRGIPDFTFDTYDSLYLAGRLRTNLADAAAQQASIVYVRQHDSGTKDDVQAFVDGDADLTETQYLTGTQQSTKYARRGGREDIPKGMNYVPGPIASSQPIHIQVLDACLRGAGMRWQAPPWLMSGDLNAMNYATSLTAESPFVRTILRRQRAYCEAFRRPVWAALEHYVRTNGLRDKTGHVWAWEEIEPKIKLLVTAPSPETRNKLEEANRAAIEIPLGVQSRQKYAQEQGRDFDQVAADNQEYEDRFGGMGQTLPMPGEPGAGGADGGNPFKIAAGTGRPESLLESVLLEHGFTGTDRLGRKWVDGKLVPRGDTPAAKGGDSKESGTFPAAQHITDGLAEKIAAASPEAAKQPKLVSRIQDVALSAAAKVYGKLVELTPAMWKVMDAAGLVFDTPQDLQKLGYHPTMAGGQDHAPPVQDALRNATGISTHLAATVASHVLAKVAVYVKAKMSGGKTESDEGDVLAALADVLHETLAALAEEFGLSEPPDSATIAANLKKLTS